MTVSSLAPGLGLIQAIDCWRPSQRRRRIIYQISVLLLTFVAYMSYHIGRKPSSVVKATLNPTNSSDPSTPGFYPFNEGDGNKLLGSLDSAFLFSYAFGMFISGHIADRISLRYFLTVGMILTGIFTAYTGFADFFDIHELGFFYGGQILSGLAQSTGWPAVVAVVGNWVGHDQRGLIMGIWNSHTSIGNILGGIVGSVVLDYGWGWVYIVTGSIIAVVGLILFFFLAERPSDVGLEDTIRASTKSALPHSHVSSSDEYPGYQPEKGSFEDKFLQQRKQMQKQSGLGGTSAPVSLSAASISKNNSTINSSSDEKPSNISFFRAWFIPGVFVYAISLFFCKLVSYTFLYWLPFYIDHTKIGGKTYGDSDATQLATLFDVGGIIGGIMVGIMSDKSKMPACVSALYLYLSVPILYMYRVYGVDDLATNIGLMIVTGAIVQGPYNLITTAVSADLGTHHSLKGNAKALATVTAIIDGTGSIGAALGPFLVGVLVDGDDDTDPSHWDNVFWMLMAMEGVAGILLTHLVWKEISAFLNKKEGYQELSRTAEEEPHIVHRLASVY